MGVNFTAKACPYKLVKVLTVPGVRVGTATRGMPVKTLGAAGVAMGGLMGFGAVVLIGATTLAGIGVLGVGLAGGVTVIAGVAMPMARLVAHNIAITRGLMLLWFMVAAPVCRLDDYF